MSEYLWQKGQKYGVLFDLGIETGLRVSDILSLKAKSLKRRELKLTEQKTKTKRTIEISNQLRENIKKYIRCNNLNSNDFLIPSNNKHKNKHLSRSQAYRVIKEASMNLEINKIGTHSMRKTYALNHFKENKNIQSLNKEMKHKYLNTTIMYLVSGLDIFNT